MKKVALLFTALLIAGVCGCWAVPQVKVSPEVYSAISMYKQKNYTGAIQNSKAALEKNPNDILAQYYLAISYAQLGMKDKALEAFDEIVQKGSADSSLTKIAKEAVACYGDPTKCKARDNIEDFKDSTTFLEGGADDDKKLLEKELREIRNTINKGGDFDPLQYKYINDAKDEMPTNEEIANAVKVLAKAGFNPYANAGANMYNSGASSDLANLSAFLGGSNNSNDFNNIIPYLMAQRANGSGGSKIDPKVLQSMMMNHTIQNFGFDNNDRNY